MALPQSFQEALGRAKTERNIEQDNILQRIGETVQKGVPLLSGVIAGALSRNPIVGVGAAFIADKLQQRAEEKRQQRATRRFEMRQRKEAAQIAVREGLFQNEKEALQAIEANRLVEEQENTKKREQEVLQRFGLNQEEEKVQDQEKENVEQQEELVREPPQQTGLALETTVSHIDSEISGIADLLLDRFAEEEDRFDRAEDRRELEAAQLRETIAEGNRQQPPEGTPVREDRQEDEQEGGGILGGAMRFIGALGNIARVVLVGALIGLGIAIYKLIENLPAVIQAIGELATQIYIAVKDAIVDAFDSILDFTGLGAASDEFKQRRQLATERLILEEEGKKIQSEAQSVQQEIVDAQQRQEDLGVENEDIIAKVITQGPQSLTNAEALQFADYKQAFEDQQLIIDTARGTLTQLQKDRQVLQQKIDDLNQRIEQFQQQSPSLNAGNVAPPSTAGLGNQMAKVSFDTVAKASPVVFAPTDASTQVQNTSVNNSKQVTVTGRSSRNDEVRGKFVYA